MLLGSENPGDCWSRIPQAQGGDADDHSTPTRDNLGHTNSDKPNMGAYKPDQIA